MKRKDWTREDLKILKKLYYNRLNEDLSEIFHRSPGAIANKAFKLGLRKNPKLIASKGFQKGYTPFNKGKKMEEWLSPEVHEKILANQKRTADRNRQAAAPDGTIVQRTQGYYIKVDGKWEKMSHFVWEKERGQIPAGCAIFHKDGDIYNASIENLYIGPKNNPTAILKQKNTSERQEIHKKIWETRRANILKKQEAKMVQLDNILEEIRRSNNNIYYKPDIYI